MKSVLIIGLGRLGHHLCMKMAELGNEILIVDQDEEQMRDLLQYATLSRIGDCTDVEVLRSLGVGNYDLCYVCIGSNFQSSLEITSLLKEMGAKYVVSKANRDIQAYHEAVKSQVSALMFHFLNIFCSGLNLKKSTQHTAHYRQQDYVRQFMSLLSLHFREQRRVTFYSEQMHITPKYLGTIVTQQTGRTVSDWIDHFVVSEAKVLLGSSSLTIQEITYKLNFPSQSFFCKYFKAHTGMTPSGFRTHHQ